VTRRYLNDRGRGLRGRSPRSLEGHAYGGHRQL